MKLYDHQRRAVELARVRPRHAFFWEMGCGKTMALLAVCAERRLKTLVLCPRSVINAAWVRDAANFPDLKAVCLWHPSKARRRALVAGAWDVGVINYESFKTMIPELRAAGVERLVCDESSKIKSTETATTKAVIAFADKMMEVYLLSGTPAPNNGTEYWPQVRCVEPRWSGLSFWGWAHKYFSPVRRKNFSGREYIATWTPNAAAGAEFAERLRACSWALSKEECVDLPEKIDRIVEVDLGPDEAEAYRAVEEEMRILDPGGKAFSVRAEAVLMKARQITGGAVLVGGEAVGLGSSKLDALAEVVEEAGNQPIVVWAEFTQEIDRIRAMLMQIGHTEIIDGRTSADAGRIAADFQAGKTRFLVCHPAAAGHGITLTAAAVAVYFSLSFSSELHLQSRDRIHRVGQTRKCVYVYLLARDTVDWSAFRALRAKKSRADLITDALRVRASAGAIVDELGISCS